MSITRRHESDFVKEATALITRHEYDQAVKVCRQGLLSDPHSLEGRIAVGVALMAQGRANEVLAEMRIAADIDPSNALVHLLKAQASLGLRDYAKARTAISRVQQLDANNETARALLVTCEEQSGGHYDPLDPKPTTTLRYPAVRRAAAKDEFPQGDGGEKTRVQRGIDRKGKLDTVETIGLSESLTVQRDEQATTTWLPDEDAPLSDTPSLDDLIRGLSTRRRIVETPSPARRADQATAVVHDEGLIGNDRDGGGLGSGSSDKAVLASTPTVTPDELVIRRAPVNPVPPQPASTNELEDEDGDSLFTVREELASESSERTPSYDLPGNDATERSERVHPSELFPDGMPPLPPDAEESDERDSGGVATRVHFDVAPDATDQSSLFDEDSGEHAANSALNLRHPAFRQASEAEGEQQATDATSMSRATSAPLPETSLSKPKPAAMTSFPSTQASSVVTEDSAERWLRQSQADGDSHINESAVSSQQRSYLSRSQLQNESLHSSGYTSLHDESVVGERPSEDHNSAADDSWRYSSAGVGRSNESVGASEFRPSPQVSSKRQSRLARGRRRGSFIERVFVSARRRPGVLWVGVTVCAILVALGIGSLVGHLRQDQESEQTRQAILRLLRRGNLSDFQGAIDSLTRRVQRTHDDLSAWHLLRRIQAQVLFEYGVRVRVFEAPAEKPDARPDENMSALQVLQSLNEGKLQAASDRALEARNLHPRSHLIQYLQGRIELLRGDSERAVEYFRRAEQLQKGDALVLCALGDALQTSADYNGAEESYARALKINRAHVASLLGQARLALASERSDRARKLLKSILEGKWKEQASAGQRGWAFLVGARQCVLLGQIGSAQTALREAWQHMPAQDPTFLDELARLLIDAYRLGEAEEAANRAGAMMPGRPFPPLLKGRIYLEQGREKDALEAVEAGDIAPELAALLKARIYVALSQPAVARRALVSATRYASQIDVGLVDAEISVVERNFEQAERSLTALLAKHPNDPRVLTALAAIRLAMKNPLGAQELLAKATQAADGAVMPQLMMADVLLAQGKFDAAHQQLIRVTRGYSWLLPGSLRLARLNLGRRDLGASRIIVEALLKEDANDQNARALLIDVLIQQRDFMRAEHELLQLKGMAPGRKALIEGRLALAKEETERAISRLNVAKNSLAVADEPLRWLVRALLFAGKVDAARKEFAILSRRFPNAAESQIAAARIELAMARSTPALRYLKQGLQKLSAEVRVPAEESDVLVLIGKAYHEADRVREARLWFGKAQEVCPFCPEPLIEQGLANFEVGKSDKAIELLTHAARLSPRFPRVYYELGKLFETAKKPQKAVQMYRKYLKLGPPEEFAQEVRQIIENLGY